MDMIAPVFHPRARVSALVEARTAEAMLARTRAEGHRPWHRNLRTPAPLTEDDLAQIAAARERLAEGASPCAIARAQGVTKKRMCDLLARAGIARDGSEVRR